MMTSSVLAGVVTLPCEVRQVVAGHDKVWGVAYFRPANGSRIHLAFECWQAQVCDDILQVYTLQVSVWVTCRWAVEFVGGVFESAVGVSVAHQMRWNASSAGAAQCIVSTSTF